ncbi:uncharacterized protein VTP21DRAFT_3313 [Calcarisporiella thermophila]|uniref:uncharacterized protein n=1 Tax=Calcarisporiella thermophila TaxID=911321 RepID=UPI0037426140
MSDSAFDKLAEELLDLIFSFLPFESLVILRSANKRFAAVAHRILTNKMKNYMKRGMWIQLNLVGMDKNRQIETHTLLEFRQISPCHRFAYFATGPLRSFSADGRYALVDKSGPEMDTVTLSSMKEILVCLGQHSGKEHELSLAVNIAEADIPEIRWDANVTECRKEIVVVEDRREQHEPPVGLVRLRALRMPGEAETLAYKVDEPVKLRLEKLLLYSRGE